MLIALGLLVVTALQLWVLKRQTDILDGQRKDAVEGGKQTEAIARANERAAGANERTAKAMERIVAQQEVSLKATTEQGKQSLRQSRAALERTIEMSRIAQRAWLGVNNIKSGELKEGLVFRTEVEWKNSGLTPATNVRAFVRYKYRPAASTGSESLSTILPGGTARSPTQPVVIATEDIATIRTGKATFHLFGRATYDDVFGRHHHTTFGAKYDPDTGDWINLSTYNAAD